MLGRAKSQGGDVAGVRVSPFIEIVVPFGLVPTVTRTWSYRTDR